MIELRPYQHEIAAKACALLQQYGLVYLSMQVRTGKTLTAMEAARLFLSKVMPTVGGCDTRNSSYGFLPACSELCRRCKGATSVLFLTTKKAIGSIEADYAALQPPFALDVINYESALKYSENTYDLVICDEAHRLGSFPKPAKRAEEVRYICNGKPVIFLSGTPTPEADPQIFHQLYVSSRSPFAQYKTFYKWAADYVYKEVRKFNGWDSNDYSMNSGATVYTLQRQIKKDSTIEERERVRAEIASVLATIEEKKQLIRSSWAHINLSFSQQDAGFIQDVKEEVIYVRMKDCTYYLAKKLLKDKVAIGNDGSEILGDTPVKLKGKLQQIYSGAVLSEKGEPRIFDDTKARVIAERFTGQKIAVFYKFQAELAILKAAFGMRLTDSPEVFAASGAGRIFCSQIQSGREGIDLSTADALIMFNIDFSSVSYQQARARLQSKDRTKECRLYWLFAEGGIEDKIYAAVINKQDYTLRFFKRDFKIQKEAKTA